MAAGWQDDSLVEEAQHLATREPPPSLLVRHDAVRRREHDVSELLFLICGFGKRKDCSLVRMSCVWVGVSGVDTVTERPGER